ncbi:hypothetical protein D3C87_1731970 [compost metagenome]
MAQRHMEYPALAIAEGDQHGFVTVRAVVCFGRKCRGQYLHVFGWAPQAVVQLVATMQPACRHAFRNGVVRFTDSDFKLHLCAVRAGLTRLCIAHLFAILIEIHIRTVLFRPVAPTAEPDHLVIGRPLRK